MSEAGNEEPAAGGGGRAASLESSLAPLGEKPAPWQRKRQPEVCAHCAERPPDWLVLDPKTHIWVYFKWGSEESTESKEQNGYLLCDRCKKLAVKAARRGRVARLLKCVRWK